MFDFSGKINEPSNLSGNLLFPMFELNGSITSDRSGATADVEVWVLNTESKHHSTYNNWQINSFGMFNGQPIAAMPDGLYQMNGADDAGADITGKIYWPPSDLTSRQQKALEAAFIRLRGNVSDISFVVVIDETEKRIFNISMAQTKEGNCVKRVPMPRGFKGNLYQFGIEYTGSSNIEMFEVEVISMELGRKLK
jgi:hypothetical protein